LPEFDANADEPSFPNSDIASAWDSSSGWLALWANIDLAALTNRSNNWLIFVEDLAAGKIEMNAGAGADYQVLLRNVGEFAIEKHVNHSDWTFWVVSWDGTTYDMYFQGVMHKQSAFSSMGAPGGNFAWRFPAFEMRGGFGHSALGAGESLTEEGVNRVFEQVYPNAGEIFFSGDSFATDNDFWIDETVGNILTSDGSMWRERPYRVGLSGQRVADLHTYLDANLSSLTGDPAYCAVHIGTNDLGSTAEASFKSDLEGCVDALYARWPDAEIYCAKPYKDPDSDGGYDTDADNMAGWIDDVVAGYSYAFAGPDFTSAWWKGNLATLSDDGVHPNNAGHTEIASQWQSVLGF
jgi:hypothetical protein